MKQIHIAGNLLKSLMLAGLLTACHNDQMVTPAKNTEVVATDQSAKVSAALRLVKDDQAVLQYIKNGKFSGKISKITGNEYRIEYTYDNNNPAGDLWITCKHYIKSSNELKKHFQYQVINGICIASQDVKYGYSYLYKYGPQNLLDEVQISNNASGKSETRKYLYAPSGAASGFRLYKIATSKKEAGEIVSNTECTITYTTTQDKYPLNPEYTELDQHLPIFGKFSDVLPKEVYKTGTIYNILQQSLTKYTYGTDVDGLVTSRKTEYVCTDNPSVVSYYAILKYSTNWQGIPGNP